MKKINLLTLIFFAVLVKAEDKGTPILFRVVKDVKDSTLSKEESILELKFFDGRMKSVSQVSLSYNGTEKTVVPDGNNLCLLTLKPGKYNFMFYYNPKHIEIKVNDFQLKARHRLGMEVYFKETEMMMNVDKPVIYVYSEKDSDVSIELDVKGRTLFTYPQYENAWKFSADKNGTISMDDKKFSYLFWDAQMKYENIVLKDGFVVGKEDLTGFFEKNLAAMGLNARESEDFITYWCPRMMKFDKVKINFVFNSDYDQFASIKISPSPDNLFRVMMLWREAEKNEKASPQKIESFKRNGLTIVEWGGVEMPTVHAKCN